MRFRTADKTALLPAANHLKLVLKAGIGDITEFLSAIFLLPDIAPKHQLVLFGVFGGKLDIAADKLLKLLAGRQVWIIKGLGRSLMAAAESLSSDGTEQIVFIREMVIRRSARDTGPLSQLAQRETFYTCLSD